MTGAVPTPVPLKRLVWSPPDAYTEWVTWMQQQARLAALRDDLRTLLADPDLRAELRAALLEDRHP